MTFINPINVNTAGVGTAGYGSLRNNSGKAETKEEAQAQAGTEKQQVEPDKVLDYMAGAANANVVQKTKTVNPADYVDSASAQRIAGFVQGFEDKVADGLKAFDAEFEGVDVSDGAKMAVVLGQIDKEMN